MPCIVSRAAIVHNSLLQWSRLQLPKINYQTRSLLLPFTNCIVSSSNRYPIIGINDSIRLSSLFLQYCQNKIMIYHDNYKNMPIYGFVNLSSVLSLVIG